MRGNDSVANVEKSVLRVKRDRDSRRTGEIFIITWNGKLNLPFDGEKTY